MKQGQQILQHCAYEKEERYDPYMQQNVLSKWLCFVVILFKENLA